VGTDIGGSIRLPAGWCALVGLKPSLGRVPIHPPYAGRVAGPMTRTVRDAALMMAALARPDWRDTMSLPHQVIAWDDIERDVKGLRIGLQLDAGWGLPVEPAVRQAVQAAAHALEADGAVVEPMGPFMTRAMIDGMDDFWRMRSWLDIAALPPERREKVLPYIRAWVARGAQLDGPRVFNGYSQMGAMRDAAVAACHPHDFVLSPTAPGPAFDAHLASPLDDPQRPFEHIAFTLPYNMSEQPAISVNWSYTGDGLPIGVQIAGARHDDRGVLRLARAVERLRPPQRPWPMEPAGA
jgi:Asp-tRNA(Asn)/Glu-tRNA(Gln) amidotransferase A subunit family amidase